MRITLGFSTCPNDTFIFDAMIHGKIDTEGLAFDVILSDVENLNRMAFEGLIQVTKLSFHAFPFVAQKYTLLHAGSALGRKNGPLLISKALIEAQDLPLKVIAIPGKFTTANLLFSIFYPNALKKSEFVFSEIEEALLEGVADAGVIIHENRFTYQQKGLKLIADLGEMWEKYSGFPIPLGGIAADKSLGTEVICKIDRVLKRSVAFALANPGSSTGFVKENAKELSELVIRQHINLYVNEFTVDLGEEGRKAVSLFFREAQNRKLIPELPEEYFITSE
jgi:1,4-dihydroxy-6-naphthoate synthase